MTVSWTTALYVWWGAAWRGFIYSLVGVVALTFIGGVVAGMLQGAQGIEYYSLMGGYLIGIPASILALKQSLQKNSEMLARNDSSGEAGQR